PGHPDICNVFSFHKLYTSPEKVSQIEEDCKKAIIGCVECKKLLAENLIKGLAPLQEKRQYYQEHLGELKDIIDTGIKKARSVATTTLEKAKEAIGI
ncbi:MAG: tryptophan--tRNA ligase, partial [Thermodesulfobacteriota bacterium]